MEDTMEDSHLNNPKHIHYMEFIPDECGIIALVSHDTKDKPIFSVSLYDHITGIGRGRAIRIQK